MLKIVHYPEKGSGHNAAAFRTEIVSTQTKILRKSKEGKMTKTLLLLGLATALLFASAYGQVDSVYLTADSGVAVVGDTIYMEPGGGGDVKIAVNCCNETPILAFTYPFVETCGVATLNPAKNGGPGFPPVCFIGGRVNVANWGAQVLDMTLWPPQFLLGGVAVTAPPLWPGDGYIAKMTFTMPPGSPDTCICIDTAFFAPSGMLTHVDTLALGYTPLFTPKCFPVVRSPQIDWDIYDPVIVEDTTIMMNGNVTVHPGGSVTLDNVILKMNVMDDGQYHIEVDSGGAMYILNGSVITDGDADNDLLHADSLGNARFLFWVRKGAKFEMRHSELHECGYEFDDDHWGLFIWADSVVIDNNLMSHNFMGITLASDHCTTTGNTVSYNNADGIHLESAWQNELSRNIADHNGYQGLFMDGSEWNKLSFNHMRLNNETGIVVFRSDNNTLIHNIASDNTINGIYAEQSDFSVIRDNSASGNGRCGISIGQLSSNIVEGNTMNNNVIGMSVGSGDVWTSLVCHNTISDNIYGISLWGESNSNIMDGNMILNNDYGILAVTANSNVIEGNTISNNGYGIYLTYKWFYKDEGDSGISENNTVINNLITSNDVGIFLDSASVNTEIIYNTISENTDDGIKCIASSGTKVNCNNITNNAGYGVVNVDLTEIVNAVYNWWGDPSGPGGVGPGSGDEVSQYVDYELWSDRLVAEIDLEIAEVSAYVGQIVYVPVLIRNKYPIGGFKVYVEYDPTVLIKLDVERGELINDFDGYYDEYGHVPRYDFQYFEHRQLPCGQQCETYKIKIVGIADTPDSWITGPLPAGGCEQGELIKLKFKVAKDANLQDMFLPIKFEFDYDFDPVSNSLSSVTGESLFVDINWPGELTGPNYDILPIVTFTDGGVKVHSDAWCWAGDINMNEYPYEIADAVVFANYFLYGEDVFDIDPDIQVLATDVNQDGFTLSMSDFVFLIRIILEDTSPKHKLVASEDLVQVALTAEGDAVKVASNSNSTIGAGLYVFRHSGEVKNLIMHTDMDVKYHDADGELRVLVYSFEGKSIPAGVHELFSFEARDVELTQVEAVDFYGSALKSTISTKALPARFALMNSYPNPFNLSTSISFALPVDSKVSLKIYNIAGQLVKSFQDVYEAGSHRVTWDGTNAKGEEAASGIYFYRLVAGDFTQTKKMLLIK